MGREGEEKLKGAAHAAADRSLVWLQQRGAFDGPSACLFCALCVGSCHSTVCGARGVRALVKCVCTLTAASGNKCAASQPV